ncbi:cbb3-type cytochrome c oxidase subunit 3 [Psychromonas sp. SR45-3]|uniref:cbb3-type cytochrome oxidase subunit 3 n=1 Tax=Psychromonas sp. SR45-3 TaxID=2760930 RepID=UPI0015F7E65C|nr:cbb3-type cytochrome c oxidase subunit 3 [Psychromonas sp. SR45-3]MBB1274676.1 cbb3-type cytochrome c oxidase subunit 3 [Psychromonas sp. SR45-3]
MDFATFNGLYTLFLIIIFVALILWAYSKKQKQTFEEMGNSILEDDLDSKQYESTSSEHTGAKK